MSANPFADRMLTQSVTPEFMREIAGVEDDDQVLELLETATELFERSYNAVAGVSDRPSGFYGWNVYVIPAKDADGDSIRRGMQSITYWVQEMGEVEA